MSNPRRALRATLLVVSSSLVYAALATGCSGSSGPAGPEGKTGPKGAEGPKGDPGATGPMGSEGKAGATGATGATGPKGSKGDPGSKGATGPAGAAGGPDGGHVDGGSGDAASETGAVGDGGDAGASIVGTLSLTGASVAVTLPLTSFTFGIANAATVGSGGAGAGKAQLSSLSVTLATLPPDTTLETQLFAGKTLTSAELDLSNTAAGESFAKFKPMIVSSVQISASGSGSPVEGFTFAFGSVELDFTTAGDAGASGVVDPTNGTTCPDICCATPALGPYVVLPAGVAAPPGKLTSIDSFATAVTDPTSVGSGSGGAGAGKAMISHVQYSGSYDAIGACPLFYAGSGTSTNAVTFDLDQSTPAGGKAVIDEQWQVCEAFTTSVDLSSTTPGVVEESVTLAVGGAIITDDEANPPTTTGWSFVTNSAIAACPD